MLPSQTQYITSLLQNEKFPKSRVGLALSLVLLANNGFWDKSKIHLSELIGASLNRTGDILKELELSGFIKIAKTSDKENMPRAIQWTGGQYA